jgi:hypothetical protein
MRSAKDGFEGEIVAMEFITDYTEDKALALSTLGS